LRDTARAADVVARTGGEEFTVLVTDTDDDGAAQLAMRLVEAVRGRPYGAIPGRGSVTLSAGVATLDATIEDVVRLLRVRADEALYAAKRAGRDRVVRWAPVRPAGAA
jgi:diguanylate cyclase (GGDEF)-like protein